MISTAHFKWRNAFQHLQSEVNFTTTNTTDDEDDFDGDSDDEND